MGFLRPYKVSLIVSIVLAVASQGAAIALIWLTGTVIDKALATNDHQMLWILVGAVLAVGFARAALMAGRRLISGRQALAVEMDMRQALYAHLIRLSFGFYDRNQTGQLMSRATVDLQGVRFFLGYGLIFFFQNAITVLSVTVVLLVFNWKLALIALAITPVLVAVAYRYSHVTHPTLREVQQKLADVATVAEENIVGVHVVKSFAQEPQESAKFHERSEAVFRQTLRANRQRALYVPFISWVPLLAQGAVLLVGARMVTSGELSIGQFVSFNLYLGMLVTPLRSLGMWIGQSQRATASGERIFQVMDEPEEIADTAGRGRAAAGRGGDPVRGRAFEYLDGATGAGRRDARRAGGPDSRADRADRLRQDDAHLARAALLRRDLRPGVGRRGRRPRRDADLAAPGDRRHLAGPVPVLGDRAREHHLRRRPAWTTRRSNESRDSPRRTSSSQSSRRATTRSSASVESRCRAGSASGWRSPGRSPSTRGS